MNRISNSEISDDLGVDFHKLGGPSSENLQNFPKDDLEKRVQLNNVAEMKTIKTTEEKMKKNSRNNSSVIEESKSLENLIFHYNRTQRILWWINTKTDQVKSFDFQGVIESYSDSGIGVVSDSKIVIIGGTNSENHLTNKAFLLDPITLITETLGDLPLSVKKGQIIEYKNKLIYVGGISRNELKHFNEIGAPVFQFNYLKKKWKILFQMTRELYENDSTFDIIYDPESETSVFNIYDCAVLRYHSKMYIFCGKINHSSQTLVNNKVFSFDLKNKCLNHEMFNGNISVNDPIFAYKGARATIIGEQEEKGKKLFHLYRIDLRNKEIKEHSILTSIKTLKNYPGLYFESNFVMFSDNEVITISKNSEIFTKNFKSLYESNKLSDNPSNKISNPIMHDNIIEPENSNGCENKEGINFSLDVSIDFEEISYSRRQLKVASSKVEAKMIDYLNSQSNHGHGHLICCSIDFNNPENADAKVTRFSYSLDLFNVLFSFTNTDKENLFLRHFPRRWPNSIVPYEIHPLLAGKKNNNDESIFELIQNAINVIAEKTKISFVEDSSSFKRLKFKWHRKRTYCNGLGKNIDRENIIFLCGSVELGNIFYEIMHKLGVMDEYQNDAKIRFLMIPGRLQKVTCNGEVNIDYQLIAISGFTLGPTHPDSIMQFLNEKNKPLTDTDTKKISFLYSYSHCFTFFSGDSYFFFPYFFCVTCFSEISSYLICLPCAYIHHQNHETKILTYQDIIQENYDKGLDFSYILSSNEVICDCSELAHKSQCLSNTLSKKRKALYCCHDCTPENSKKHGLCLYCIKTCHDGHNTELLKASKSFKCKCGPKFCGINCQGKSKSFINYINMTSELRRVNITKRWVKAYKIKIPPGIFYDDSGHCTVNEVFELYYGIHWIGYTSSNFNGQLYMINTIDKKIELLGSHKTKSQMGLCELNGNIYVFGGNFDGKATSECETFNLVSKQWTNIARLPINSFIMKCQVDEKMIFIGSYHFFTQYDSEKNFFVACAKFEKPEHRLVVKGYENEIFLIQERNFVKFNKENLGICKFYNHGFTLNHFVEVIHHGFYAYFMTGYNSKLFRFDLNNYHIKQIELN